MLSLVEGLKLTSVLATGYMAGSGLYISLVEVPSRRQLSAQEMWKQFAKSFNLAARSMMLSGLLTASAPTYLYFLTEGSPTHNLWLVSPVCFLIGSVYTFGFIIPDVKVMLDDKIIEKKGEKWFEDAVATWGKKHLFRTFINSVNFICMTLAVMRS